MTYKQRLRDALRAHPIQLPGLSCLMFAGGSVAVSATVKEGDRNVLKLKFARPKRATAQEGAAAGTGQAPLALYAVQQQVEEYTDYQRSRPRRKVRGFAGWCWSLHLASGCPTLRVPLIGWMAGSVGPPGALCSC